MSRSDRLKMMVSQMHNLQRYFTVIRQCSQLLRFQRKEHIQYYNIRGVAYLRLQNYALAMKDFDDGIALLRAAQYPDTHLLELFLFNRAMAYFLQKNYVNAERDLAEISTLNPQVAYPYFYRGEISIIQKNKKLALIFFLHALFLDPCHEKPAEDENKENEYEFDQRKINVGVLLNFFTKSSKRKISHQILSFPHEYSIILLQQCKDNTTFLGKMCAELEEKEKEQIESAINYRILMTKGITTLFRSDSLCVPDMKKIRGERRALSRSQ